MTRFTRRAIAMVAAGGLVLAACGGDDDDTAESTPTETDAPDTTAAATTMAPETTEAAPTTMAPETTAAAATTMAPETSEAPADGALLSLADTEFGQVLVDAEGLTLYMFVPDSDGVPTCTGECAAAWPPYSVDEGAELTVGEGLDASLLSVVPHPDGGSMLKYGDWPLYFFANDGAPGDVNGQGVNDVWWVVDATGAPVMN